MVEDSVIKQKLLEYSFYDEQHKLNVLINKNYIKELFGADIILLEETQHK